MGCVVDGVFVNGLNFWGIEGVHFTVVEGGRLAVVVGWVFLRLLPE